MRAMPTDVTTLPIGSRVVVRSLLDPPPEPGGGPTMTDAVGTLAAVDDRSVVVQTAGGEVRIDRSRIVAAKEVPPRPSRRGAAHLALSVEDMQRVVAPSWGAVEREQLGDWMLRASGGFTHRGNSVLPLGSPGLPLALAVDRLEDWYAERQLPAMVTLAGPEGFDPADDPLGAELLGRGYAPETRTLCLTAGIDTVADADPGGPDVTLSATLDEGWMSAYRESRPTVPGMTEQVLTGSPRQLFASVTVGGGLSRKLGLETPASRNSRIVAIGRLGIAAGWAGLGAVRTDPAFRGRGLAAHLTARLATAARQDGIRLMHLQVEADNLAATQLYSRLGFQTHSSYVYLTRTVA
jgi:N-acetylglutamate synthase